MKGSRIIEGNVGNSRKMTSVNLYNEKEMKKMIKEKEKLFSQNKKLVEDNDELEKDNVALFDDNKALMAENELLRQENEELKQIINGNSDEKTDENPDGNQEPQKEE